MNGLVEVLAAHGPAVVTPDRSVVACRCGPKWNLDQHSTHPEHVAAVILAHLRAVAADEGVRALREAADNMPLNRPGQPYEHAAAWLRRRADILDPARPSEPG